MYFDFEDHRPDTPSIPRPMSSREVVLITVNLHLLVLVAILLGPRLPFVQAILEQQRAAQAELMRQEPPRESPRFVFVQPRMERPAAPSPRAEMSDLDRRARTVERAPDPRNALPFSRGNTVERMDEPRSPSPTPPAAGEPAAAPEAEAPTQPQSSPLPAPEAPNGFARDQPQRTRSGSMGVLADAIRNVQKYGAGDKFANLQGGQDLPVDPFIDFDSKGVDFGWWLARFKAQVRRNWLPLIPPAAMTMHGHVVVTFYVHKDGRISEVTVAKPSSVNGFTVAARSAIFTSNPTVPLPTEYPDDRAFFTVTFFYNEYQGTP